VDLGTSLDAVNKRNLILPTSNPNYDVHGVREYIASVATDVFRFLAVRKCCNISISWYVYTT
jgi:hypothetical protein